MDELERKLTEFRVQNNGRLPDQVDANMRQLQALQANLTFLATSISRAGQEKLQMETNLRIFKEEVTARAKEPVDLAAAIQQKNERLGEVDREIQQWENMLSNLRKQYTERNPDVQTVVNRLSVAKQRRETLMKEEAQEKEARKDTPPPARPVNPQIQRELRDLEASIQRIQSSIEAKDFEMAEYNNQMKRANDQIKQYQGRIETVPLGERQYGELIRERDLARSKYVDMDDKLGRAKVSQDMEGRRQGELLELLDSASLPTDPTEPKRPLVISIGAALGLLLGVVIAGAREVKDTSLKNLKDVRAYTQMQILGSVPLLENDFVVRRRRRLAWLGWTTTCLASAVTMAGSIVYYYVSKV